MILTESSELMLQLTNQSVINRNNSIGPNVLDGSDLARTKLWPEQYPNSGRTTENGFRSDIISFSSAVHRLHV